MRKHHRWATWQGLAFYLLPFAFCLLPLAADLPVSQFPSTNKVTITDILPIVTEPGGGNRTSRKITVGDWRNYNTPVMDSLATLLAKDPSAVVTNVYVMGRDILGDGGEGTFAWLGDSAAATNLGTVFLPTYASPPPGRWVRKFQGPINTRWFGAKGDGATDDTAAVKSGYDSIGATASGDLYFPVTGKPYLFNLVVTHDNHGLIGGLANDTRSTLVSFKAFDLTKPVLQVGDDSGYVYGFKMKNISIDATTCPSALYLFAGPNECAITDCSFYNGTNTVFLKGGSNFPVTLISFNNCSFWEGSNATLYCLRPVAANGYVTGIYLNGCHVNGHNSSGYAVRLDRTILSSVNTYYDLNDNHALWIANGGHFRGFNVELEAVPNGIGLITISDESVHDPSRFIEGHVKATGTIIYADATTDVLPAPDSQLFNWQKAGYFKTSYLNEVYVVATGGPFSTANKIEATATNGPVRITSGTSSLEIKPSIRLSDATGLNYGDILPNGAGGGLYLGAMGSNQNIRFVPSGTGILDFRGPESHLNVSDFLNNIHVWGGGGARAGLLSSVGGGGGLYLAAEGSNQNIRMDVTGTGFVDIRSPITIQQNVRIGSGTGSPEGVIVGSIGDVWFRMGTSSATAMYIKDVGTGNTGWLPITGGGVGTVTNFNVGDMSTIFTVSNPTTNPTLAAVNPGGHRLYGWDNTDGAPRRIIIGANLTYNAGTDTLDASAGAGGYVTVLEEATPLTARTKLNFIGTALTATDNGGTTSTDVTVDSDVNAIASLATTGLITRTGAGTATTRTATAGSGITITNGDGVAGNPTVALNITGLPAETVIDTANDTIPFYDASEAANNKMTFDTLKTAISAISYLTATGSGADFTPAAENTYEKLAFGGGDLALALTTGTWAVTATVNWTSANSRTFYMKLRNSSDAVDIATSERLEAYNSGYRQLVTQRIITVGSTKTIQVWVKVDDPSYNVVTVEAVRCDFQAIKLSN